jgi:hypothetical protein
MKLLKGIFLVIVASLDIYAFSLWVTASTQTQSHNDAVQFFLNGWPWLNSVLRLSLFLMFLTLTALIIVNIKPFRRQIVTYLFSAVYVLFLLYSMLGFL